MTLDKCIEDFIYCLEKCYDTPAPNRKEIKRYFGPLGIGIQSEDTIINLAWKASICARLSPKFRTRSNMIL